jgi:exopolyphosphatase/guanosine-5'-triphosphate,3'-diphosphate pyrophosphatase
MHKQLIIEIGTNSIKCLKADYLNGAWQNLTDSVYPVRIGENLASTGLLDEQAINRNLDCIAALLTDKGIKNTYQIHLIATESLRRAANADEFIKQIKTLHGIEVEILSGAEEAELSYRAATYNRETDEEIVAVIDIGGGSTELTIGHGSKILSKQSLPIGAVKLTEMCFLHDPVTPAEPAKVQILMEAIVKQIRLTLPITELIGVGGTVTTLAAISSEQDGKLFPGLESTILTLETVQKMIDLLMTKTVIEIEKLPNMPSGRADIILAGSLILEKLMRQLGILEISVSVRGVRHGYLYSRI